MKILVMGLPGSGKTYLSERLQPLIESAWFNAGKVMMNLLPKSALRR